MRHQRIAGMARGLLLFVAGVVGCRFPRTTSAVSTSAAPVMVAAGRLLRFTAADTAGSPPNPVNDRFAMPVQINGRNFLMLADHGASGTMLTDSGVERIKIPHWYAGATRIDTVVRRQNIDPVRDSTADVIVTRGDTTFEYWGDFGPVIVDSLRVGTSRQDKVLIAYEAAAAALEPFDGILGREFLSAFDLEVNMPARVLHLYPRSVPARPGQLPQWLPRGVTSADCVVAHVIRHMGIDTAGMDDDARREFQTNPAAKRMWDQEELQLPVVVNDRPIDGLFDSGSGRAVINWAEAHALGITRASPTVGPFSLGGLTLFHFMSSRPAPDSLDAKQTDSTYTVTGLTLQIGTQRLPADTVMISDLTFQDFKNYRTMPLILVGLQPFRDRVLFLSYSTGRICTGRIVVR